MKPIGPEMWEERMFEQQVYNDYDDEDDDYNIYNADGRRKSWV